jgi:hypothetical protein
MAMRLGAEASQQWRRWLAPPRDIGLAKAYGVVPKLQPALRLRPVIQIRGRARTPWLAHLLLRR